MYPEKYLENRFREGFVKNRELMILVDVSDYPETSLTVPNSHSNPSNSKLFRDGIFRLFFMVSGKFLEGFGGDKFVGAPNFFVFRKDSKKLVVIVPGFVG